MLAVPQVHWKTCWTLETHLVLAVLAACFSKLQISLLKQVNTLCWLVAPFAEMMPENSVQTQSEQSEVP